MPNERRSIRLGASPLRLTNGTVVEAAAFAGEITQRRGAGPGLREVAAPADQDMAVELDRALAEVGIEVQETLVFEPQAMSMSWGMRSAQRPRDRFVIRPATPPIPAVQVILYQDESGGLSWHFSDPILDPNVQPQARSAAGAAFTIPARTAPARRAFFAASPAIRMRGPITKLGRKIFKVLLVPLSGLIDDPLRNIVGKIEARYRQETVREVSGRNYRTRVPDAFTDWSALAGKRSLLVVHGILSNTEGMLSKLPPAAMEALAACYDNRVIAFDHWTVTRSPEENARHFLETIHATLPDASLQFDVLCHSRGGIVARTLIERGRALLPSTRCSFDKAFFVGAPNQGAPLADPEHVTDMLDVFTNLLTNFPDGPVTYSLEILLAIVKLLAYTGIAELPGVAAMGTDSYVTRVLNTSTVRSPAAYAAAAADYVPDPNADNGFFNGRFADMVMDRVFGHRPNDLVVPFEGVFEANGHPSFPIRRPLRFEAADHVWHTDFFSRPPLIERLLSFFSSDVGAASAEPAAELSDIVRPTAPVVVRSASVQESMRTPVRKRAARRRGSSSPGESRSGRNGTHRLERRPHIDFPDRVVAGDPHKLVVSLSEVLAGSGAGIVFDLLDDRQQLTVSVTLDAPGFDVEPLTKPAITVTAQPHSSAEKCEFLLVARPGGPETARREITAVFWSRSTNVGCISHFIDVVPARSAEPSSRGDREPSRSVVFDFTAREECDLVIKVEGQNQAGEPPFRLRLRIPGEGIEAMDCGTFSIPGTGMVEYLNSAFNAALANVPWPGGLSKEELSRTIEKQNEAIVGRLGDLGRQLWTMLPEKFRAKYLEMRIDGAPIRSIIIHSDEMIFPWEIVVPHDFSRDLKMGPMGMDHVMGRWKPSVPLRPSPQRMVSDVFVLLRPSYEERSRLQWAEDEEQHLIKMMGGIQVLRPLNEQAVRDQLLNRHDVKLLHFSGHGDFNKDNADLSRLVLEDDTYIDALAMANTPLGAQARPIVYLNACGLGGSAITVGRAGGFANACIDSGYTGLLASHWNVNDASAARLSVELYRKLLAGVSIGEALRELRDRNRHDPAFLACAYYGDPWTRLDLRGLTAPLRKRRGRREGHVAGA